MIRFAFWEIKSFWQPHRKWISKEGLGLEAGSPLTEFNPQRDGKSLTWGGAEEEWIWASLGVWWPPAWKSGAGEGPVAYTASQTQREGWACVFRAQRQCLAYREGQLYLPASPHSYFLISMAVTSNIFSPPFPDLQTSFAESVLFLFPPLPFRSGLFFSFPFLKKSYLFIHYFFRFGCTGSRYRVQAFSSGSDQGPLCGLLIAVASLVSEYGLEGVGSVVVAEA